MEDLIYYNRAMAEIERSSSFDEDMNILLKAYIGARAGLTMAAAEEIELLKRLDEVRDRKALLQKDLWKIQDQINDTIDLKTKEAALDLKKLNQ